MAVEAKPEQSVLAPSARNLIFTYLGLLILMRPFSTVHGTTVTYYLKDHLHMTADAVAGFKFFVAIPSYVGFLFGLLRDRWNPFGRRDQGLLLVAFGAMTLLLFGLGMAPLGFGILLTVSVTKAALDNLASAGQQGLTSALGQEHVMSGRLVALWKALGAAPSFVVPMIAGYCSDKLNPHVTFALSGLVCLGLFAFSWWRPKAIYDDVAEAQPIRPRSIWNDVVRLAKTPAIYPCMAMLFLWEFTPGTGTPMQYYITDTLHGTATDFGRFDGLFGGFFVPTYLLHGFLCTRFRLRSLLWASTFVAVPQILPLMLVHSASSAAWAAIPMGLMGGFATAAYFDLLIRACPEGLEGTAMMLGSAVWALSGALGDVAGGHLYKWGGFPACAWSTFLIYGCLLLIVPLVPKHLTQTRDGEIA